MYLTITKKKLKNVSRYTRIKRLEEKFNFRKLLEYLWIKVYFFYIINRGKALRKTAIFILIIFENTFDNIIIFSLVFVIISVS